MLPVKDFFDLPAGTIYLDGNSLGPLPKGVNEHASEIISTWGRDLIRAWNSAGWISLPQRVGDRIAGLIGAPPGSVATGDTLSIKVYQAMAAGLKMRPDRRVILSDSGNFPTDLYMAQGLIKTIDKDYTLRTPAPEDVIASITDETAVVMLTHIDYRSGRMHDMQAVTEAAHAAGAVMVWDLAHSAGAVPLALEKCNAEFAVGCSYKYLNGGPGAPAFIYVRPDIIANTEAALSGWMGHDAPFEMNPEYRPAMTTERMRVGTPPIIQLAVLDRALDVWDDVDMADLRAAAIDLMETFITEIESRCPGLALASPRDSSLRGSQVSFSFEHGYAAMQAIIAKGVIGDFRPPDIMRFGFTPLYLDRQDVLAAVDIIEEVMRDELWRNPEYSVKSAVT